MFQVNIVGLSNKLHEFRYEFGNEFFQHYGKEVISEGKFEADVLLDKHETFIEVTFKIRGTATLTCDRSLDPFEHPIKTQKKVMFKYGDATEELSDEIIMIHRDTDTLELGQYIYEFIGLEVPMKKLHPRYANEMYAEGEEGKLIYSSGESKFDSDSGDDIDPRWDKLRNLK